MFTNTKLLVLVTFLILFLGFSFLWLGFNLNDDLTSSSTPPTPVESSPVVGENLESSESAEEENYEEKFLVTKVIDGDTIQLQNGQIVRLIGIDTPETVDPRRPVGCFGKEASNETKRLLTGKEVILEKDISETDKYNRILRYVYLPLEDGQRVFINKYLVLEGFAKNYTYPPDVKFNEEFLEAERQARENKKGLWGRCDTL